jgi:hypothetical protein|tara:strand:- start:25 stop:414 length:390 start_codon:yes stop_codon:yes gene_type:complete
MKTIRRILLTVLSLAITTTIIAQTTVNSEANRQYDWNERREEWVPNGEWKEENISFLLQGNVVLVRDVANSTYTMLEDAVEDGNYSTWKAIDESHSKCQFGMSREPDENNYYYIVVMYSDTLFKYAYQN